MERTEVQGKKMLKWTVKKRLTGDDINVFSSNKDGDREIRRIHTRKSLGDALGSGSKDRRKNLDKIKRRSLGNILHSNKENEGEINVVRSRQSSTPLNDSSNMIKPCKRKHFLISSSEKTFVSPTVSPISIATFKEPSAVTYQNYAPTLPSFDVEYSPVLIKTQNPVIPKLLNLSSTSSEDILPSKRLKFDMDMSYEFKPESISTSSPLSTPLTTRKFVVPSINLSSESEKSLNSSEVGDTTLQQMIDDILASAKHGKKFKKCFPKPAPSRRDQNSNFARPLSIVCETMEQKSIENLLSASKIAQAAERTLIIAEDAVKNEREVKSPLKVNESPLLKRQNAVRRKNASNENKKSKKTDESQKETTNQDSTIQKCLSFSSANFDDISEKLKTSTTSSISSGSSYISNSKTSRNHQAKGSIEIASFCDESKRKISIHGECGKVSTKI